MQASKILLSQDELDLAKNREIILTKNRIIKKIVSEFAELAGSYQKIGEAFHDLFPQEIFLVPPKISKGEQHEELPYVMLDYPRVFSKENVFAIRTFFWWGNFFSVTLHLKGIYKDSFAENILQNIDSFSSEAFFVGISNEEWRNDFQQENYVPVKDVSLEKIHSGEFIKLAVKWDLDENENIVQLMERKFRFLLEVLS